MGWRIASRNTDACLKIWGALGISLHHISQYEPAYRAAAKAAFGLDDSYPSLLAVSKGSPAAASGIQPNDRLRAVNGVDLAGNSRGQKSAASYDAVSSAMAALEAIKLITGAGEPLAGRLLLYDGLSATSRTVTVTPDPTCPVCARP